jgi:hypothetical protein
VDDGAHEWSGGNDDLQRHVAGTIEQGRRKCGDFAVGGNLNGPGMDFYVQVVRGEIIEVPSALGFSKQGFQGHSDQTACAILMGDVDRQLTGLERGARADVKSPHFVIIVSDKNQGSAADEFPALADQPDVKCRVASQDR